MSACSGPAGSLRRTLHDLFSTLARRCGFREYLAGLLLPRDRNKTLTCLAVTESVVGAQHPAVQQLQFFLSESTWDHERSIPAGWSCCWPIQRPRRTRAGCW
ncbi:hypothetical protein GCM10018966_072870 [Streptomyces yanii]